MHLVSESVGQAAEYGKSDPNGKKAVVVLLLYGLLFCVVKGLYSGSAAIEFMSLRQTITPLASNSFPRRFRSWRYPIILILCAHRGFFAFVSSTDTILYIPQDRQTTFRIRHA